MERNRERFYRGLDHMLSSGDCVVQETSALAWAQFGM